MVRKPEDLNRLVSELDRLAAPAGSSEANTAVLAAWLAQVRAVDGSDLLLVCGKPPTIRVRGGLEPAAETILDSDDIEATVLGLLGPALRSRYQSGEAVDLAFTLPRIGRFRMNLHRERGLPAVAIRALPTRIPAIADLRFTHDIRFLCGLPRGLVLIGGPTGSGKTTTLAALVAEINRERAKHVITVEDPIEYEHGQGRSIVEQVQIGSDAPDFPTALRSAVRQAPDVLVVGEMRDAESMRIALSAAETGHLVFATIHTTDCAAAVSRIVDGFPSERQNAVRQELAMTLAAMLTQTLVPTIRGGLTPIAELLVLSYGARQHIRKNALQHLHHEITFTRKLGSFAFEESLAAAVRGGAIERNEALVRAAHPDELLSLLGAG